MQDIVCWVALSKVPGIGPVLYKRLISRFGSPERVFNESDISLREVEGIGERAASGIRSFSGWKDAEQEVGRSLKSGAAIVTMHDPAYPANLLNIYDPPPFLHVKGNLIPGEKAIAMVGARFATAYGKATTEILAGGLARNGFTVVSGMARGIDTCAHKGALSSGGRTIAVLGSGIDVVYPPENRRLYDNICHNGAVISEFSTGTGPISENFPARNRIISGLSLGVVVVEASLKSGSLITASCAAEQGRDVFSVPGNINSKVSKGTNKLIKEGAKLVEDINDILEEFSIREKAPRILPELTVEESKVSDAVISQIHIDEISSVTGMNMQTVSTILLNLELKGMVRQLPGMIYMRNM